MTTTKNNEHKKLNAPIKDTCVKMLTSVDSALENNMSLCALYTLQKQHLLRQMFI